MTSAGAQMAQDGETFAQDLARANLYAIIGRLLYDAPDESLLAAIAQATGGEEEEHGPVGAAWRELRQACRTTSPVELKEEFDKLFQGVGKSEITPYSSHYVKQAAPDRHLVQLRQLLGQWQLGRRNATFETEDHVSGVCDVMRLLVSENYPLHQQELFFNEYLYPGIIPFCDAIDRSPNSVFYRCVAQLTRAFLGIEKTAFEMQDR